MKTPEEQARRWERIQNFLLAVAIAASFTGLAFVCGAIFGPEPELPQWQEPTPIPIVVTNGVQHRK